MAKIKVRNVLFNILAIITVIAVAFVLFNIFSGAKGYSVTSNSMADTLNKGDVVFSRSIDFDELKEDDIVTVRVADGSGYFTHRIAAIDYDKRTITTKGDGNISKDPMDSNENQIVGKLWYSLPLLGYISIAFSKITTAKALIIFAIIAITLIAVNLVVSSKHKKSKKVRGDSDE
jgi:signal peptidase